VHLLSFADKQREWRHQRELGGLCASVTILPHHETRASLRTVPRLLLKASRTADPAALGHFASRQMTAAAARQLARLRPEGIFVSSTVMAQFIPEQWAARTVVDLIGVNWPHWQGRFGGLLQALWRRREAHEAQLLRAYETQLVRRFAASIVPTEQDSAAFDLDEFTRRARLRVIPSGVDAELYRSNVASLRLSVSRRKWLADPQAVRLVFVGSMDEEANVEGARFFAEEVFPQVRARVPEAQFLIVGHDPAPEVKRLGKQPGVVVTGSVEDVRPYLNAATVCVIPACRSRGIHHKALEAMADGLRAQDGQQLLVAHDASEFIAAVEVLIADSRLREELAASARAFAAAAHDWPPLLARFTDLMEAVADRAEKSSTPNHAPGNSTLAKLRRRGV
jgi:glycosyltransferase involved in cell wall biosynthesis